MRNIERPWDDKEALTLREMWRDGASSSAIGKALDRSRSSVCGKVARLKLVREKKPPMPTTKTTPRSDHAKIAPARDDPATGFPAVEGYGKAVPFLKAREWHCRAVLDERGDDGLAMFCGARKVPGFSWCKHHLVRFTAPRGRA